MKVYLVQHGESVEANIDPERPLSEKGRKDIEALGRYLHKTKPEIFHILHSGKLRALQTAEILAEKLQFKNGIEFHADLKPEDDVNEIASELNHYINDILIAGHLPFMSRLVSKLVTGDENFPVVSFQPGTLVCLENVEENKWIIYFMLRPHLD